MISVIIPIYNAESSIVRMLECLQRQSHQDLEIILIDDGSSDNSYNICIEAQEKNRKIICVHQENQGVSRTRNRGLEIASGEYIAFLDADDSIDDNYFEVLYGYAHKADIIACDIVILNKTEEIARFTFENTILSSKQAVELLLQRKNINSGPCAKLFRRTIIENLEFPLLKTYEDILFVLKAFEKSESIFVTNETSYQYIENINGAMSQVKKCPSMDIVYVTEQLVEYINENVGLDDECFYITVSHLFQYIQQIYGNRDSESVQFVLQVRKLYKKHWKVILQCSKFPWKEKIVFLLFIWNWEYKNKRIRKWGQV